MLPQNLVTRIAIDTPDSTNTNTAGGAINIAGSTSLFEPLTGNFSGHLWVLDWISYSNLAGVADEQWTLAVSDDNGLNLFLVAQTVTAATNGNFFLQFTGGLPMFNRVPGGNGKTSNVPCTVGAGVSITVPILATGTLVVGYHLEPKGLRHL